MCHCRVVVDDKLPDLRLQIGDRLEVSTTQTFALNDAEYDLDLIEPGTVFRQVNKANSMFGICQERSSCGHGL